MVLLPPLADGGGVEGADEVALGGRLLVGHGGFDALLVGVVGACADET